MNAPFHFPTNVGGEMVKKNYSIKNACKRREVHAKVKVEKKKAKRAARAQRQREADELGEEAPPKQVCV